MLVIKDGISILILNENDMILTSNKDIVLKGTRGHTHNIVCLPKEYKDDYEDMEFWEYVHPTIFTGHQLHGQIKFY